MKLRRGHAIRIPEVRDYFGIRLKDEGKLKVNSNRRLRDIRRRFVEAAGVNGHRISWWKNKSRIRCGP